MSTPVEVTTSYATTVETLTDGFAFVMEYVDRVGARPRVAISPITSFDPNFGEPEEFFEVVVSGMRDADDA